MNAKRVPHLLCLISALLLLSGCLPHLPQLPLTMEPPQGTYQVTTGAPNQLTRRTFLLHVPSGYRADTPLPLVVVLHGAFSSAQQTEAETGFSALADRERFLVAYPEGTGLFGKLQHWNAGHCCGKAADDQIDDVGFLSELISAVRQQMTVDPHRIYMAGMSNGGMLTYRFAAERSGELAAAAVVSGAIGSTRVKESRHWKLPLPAKPLPMIVFHGLDDDAVPTGGGISPRKGGDRSYHSVDEAAEFWKSANRCDDVPHTTISRDGAVKQMAWTACRDGSAVEFYLLSGWGHLWPAPAFTSKLGREKPLKDFDATRMIWEFFRQHRR